MAVAEEAVQASEAAEPLVVAVEGATGAILGGCARILTRSMSPTIIATLQWKPPPQQTAMLRAPSFVAGSCRCGDDTCRLQLIQIFFERCDFIRKRILPIKHRLIGLPFASIEAWSSKLLLHSTIASPSNRRRTRQFKM